MATLQQQARALGDPTRHAIFDYIRVADEPVGIAELTAHLGLNHNAIRQHLAKLVDAALVTEATAAPTGRGRPRLIYELDPAAGSRWGATGPYERLSQLLTEIIRTGDSPVDVGRRAGLARADHAAESTEDAVAQMCDAMAREGFEPRLHQGRAGTHVILQACPFESSALADPETICQLHLGLAEGIAERSGMVQVEGLVAKDPRRANCRLQLRSDDTPDAP